MKWWPGELGINANYCVCMAQLIVGDTNHGVHGFIVQLRDLEHNKPLPGIEIGDIGPKIGWQTKDNGFIVFKNVRIPRDHMLMKYTKVDKRGQYKRRGNEKIGYAIMMQIRDLICHGTWRFLAKALTIGVRYSLIRKQFYDEEKNERTILDYQIQQDKLFVNLANCFAQNAGADKVTFLAQENIRLIQEKEDFSLMKDLHATLCACKAFYTQDTLDGLSNIRISCGGHGFSSFSGFTKMIESFIPNVTYEGDNSVMALQTARYLIKCLQKVQTKPNKEFQSNVDYLKKIQEILSVKKCQAKKFSDFDIEMMVDLLQASAAYTVMSAGKNLMNKGQDIGFKNAWDKSVGMELIEAARAHIIQYTMRCFVDKINEKTQPGPLREAMEELAMLYATEKILKNPNALIECAYLEPKQLTFLKELKADLFNRIRPKALNLVEGFHFHDNTLGSAIGRHDGKPYETLYEWVKNNNNVNTHDWSDLFKKYIKPMRDMNPKPNL